jgi:pimeloyl-ACP methyl ester carboxylesterase
MDDVRAVMDAVGSERASLFGYSEGGPMCILFAATYPERTLSLVLMGTFARMLWAPDYQPTGQGQLVAAPHLLRLSQARGHLRTRQAFGHEFHVVSFAVGLHRVPGAS